MSNNGGRERARQLYGAGSPATADEGEVARELTPEEFIDGSESALMYFVEQNAVFEELDVETEHASCGGLNDEDLEENQLHEAVAGEVEGATASESATEEDELDEWEEGLYLCRWPNGEFSVVKADSKADALVQLDEWAGGEVSWLVPLETFMADFRLDDSGAIEFNEFGEKTNEFIRGHGGNHNASKTG